MVCHCAYSRYYCIIDNYAHPMILIYLIIILMAGGVIAWITGKRSSLFSRYISLAALFIDFIIVLFIYFRNGINLDKTWLIEYNTNWIPRFGINLHLAMDGLSLLLLLLTFFIGIIAVLISWKEIQTNTGFFHFNILFRSRVCIRS